MGKGNGIVSMSQPPWTFQVALEGAHVCMHTHTHTHTHTMQPSEGMACNEGGPHWNKDASCFPTIS